MKSLLESDHLKLAGITRLGLSQSRGPKEVFVFEPHRLAFTCWALVAASKPKGLLVTLDRHFDLVPPANVADIPDGSSSLRTLDDYVRWQLDVRNFDHILAAMEAQVVGDAIVIARARPAGCFQGQVYIDRLGHPHHIICVPTVDRLSYGFGTEEAMEEARRAHGSIQNASHIFLDVDLDCFTTVSDADPTSVVPWTKELISEHVMPEGSEPFWDAVLKKTACLTLAREAAHCGGLVASGRLFETAAQVLFQNLLNAALP